MALHSAIQPPPQRTWIGSEPEATAVDDRTWLEDPNTGERIVGSRSSSAEQVDRAIAAADAANRSGAWLALGVEGRGVLLDALADRLALEADRIAELDAVSSGVPISVTRMFGGGAVGSIRQAAALARAAGDSTALDADGRDVRRHRVPWGATALILPWNAPIAMAAKQLAFALAAGAPAVLKPSPFAPWSAEILIECAREVGLPGGVVSLVHGGADVGAQLVGDARIAAISMTGATATGRAIAAAAAPRFARMRLELGSSNPAIVLADVDLDAAAEAIVAGALKLSGQWCEAPRRVLAPRPLVAALATRIHERMSASVVGSSLDDATEVGPTAYRARRAELERQRTALADGGARVLRAGTAPDVGAFFDPTLAVVDGAGLPDEVFGPMLQLAGYDSVDEAVGLANTGQVGLAGYVFGTDAAAATAVATRLVAGEVKLGGTSVLDLAPASAQSFFGSSGLGGHGDADVLDFFVGTRIIGADAPGLPL